MAITAVEMCAERIESCSVSIYNYILHVKLRICALI